MKFTILLVLCLVGCVKPVVPPPPPTPTYDMLAWMTMSPGMALMNHITGTANPLYTSITPDLFYWTKAATGHPWDIQTYDANYIYLWITELNWNNPRTFKKFVTPLPLVPRFAEGGYPGSRTMTNASTYEIHSDCGVFTTKNLGSVINEVWGPYTETLGGGLSANLQTLVISYQYGCNANFANCSDKEEFHVAQPYGLVKWQHQSLGTNGYNPPDNVTVFNKVVAGQTSPVMPCFN